MNITAKLMVVSGSLQRLAATMRGDGDSTGAQVLEDNAGRLQELAAECVDMVLVEPAVLDDPAGPSGKYVVWLPHNDKFGRGDTIDVAVASLQTVLDHEPAPTTEGS